LTTLTSRLFDLVFTLDAKDTFTCPVPGSASADGEEDD